MVAFFFLLALMFMEIISPYGSGQYTEVVVPLYASSALICLAIHFKK